jgi:hypothetical protein
MPIVGWGAAAGYADVTTMTSSQIPWRIQLLNIKNQFSWQTAFFEKIPPYMR